MSDPLSWIVIVICLIACLFFSISETSLSCCNRFKIQVKADEGSFTAKLVNNLIKKYNQSLATSLICSNAASLSASAVSTVLFIRYLQGTAFESFASLISTLFITILIFIFADGLAKTIGRAIPDTVSRIIAFPLTIILYILFPISFLFDLLMKAFDKVSNKEAQDKISEDDLEDIIEKISDDGVIEEEQGDIIQSALEFDDTKVKEILTKTNKIIAIDIKDLSHSYLQSFLANNSFSRIPIYKRDVNNIIGILIVKDYLREYSKNKDFNIIKILQKPLFVFDNMMIDDIFIALKRRQTHLAIVKNKANQVVGMVTMEDILEELVSDIAEKPLVRRGKKA